LLDTDQQAAITRLVEYDHTLLHAGMGAGKTVIAATAMTELPMRFLVVAPLGVCETTWRSEFETWSHLDPGDVAYALGGVKARTAAVRSGAKVTVINFENLPWLRKLVKQPEWEGLLIDEGTKMSTAGSERFKSIRSWIPKFQWRCVMTGAPVPEGLDRLYAQMLLVDGGACLGRNKQNFLDRWFQPTDYERRNWEPRPELVGEMLRRVAPYVWSVPDYRGSLPGLTVREIPVDLPEGAMLQYRQLLRDSVLGEVEAVNEAVLTGKLQQAAAGFLYGTDEVMRLHEAKWDVLERELCRTAEATIVVYAFTEEREGLEERGIPIYSSAMLGAWNAGKVPIMGIHPRSCGHGLNLQHGGRRMLWMGPGWSRDQHDQVIARLWRRGQTRDVDVGLLVARGTVDEAVMLRLAGKAEWEEVFRAHIAGA
jgi:hypothetical protein